jgi:hypothetical protein
MSKPTTIIIIEKDGQFKELTVKEFNTGELYKKCGFKQSSQFEKHYEWPIQELDLTIELYGKTIGRTNFENSVVFPKPMHKTKFYGNCVVVAKTLATSDYVSLKREQWIQVFEALHEVEELDKTAAEDENEVDELATVPKHLKTKDGYLKDGFVVSDTTKSKKGVKSAKPAKVAAVVEDVFDSSQFDELVEEPYI